MSEDLVRNRKALHVYNVLDTWEAGIALLERLGCRRVPLRMPHTDYAVATYYLIATAEASSRRP